MAAGREGVAKGHVVGCHPSRDLGGATFKPLTHITSKWSFFVAICSLQGAVLGSYYSFCNVWHTRHNGIVATVYLVLQWCIYDGNFHSIAIVITSSLVTFSLRAYNHMKIGFDIYQPTMSKTFSMFNILLL